MLLFSLRVDALDLRRAAAPARVAVQSAESPGRRRTGRRSRPRRRSRRTRTGSRTRRVDDVVLLADDAARVPQLRLCRRGHGRRGRARPRHSRGVRRAASATSGSIWCAARCTCCSRSRVVLAPCPVQQGVIQNFLPYLDVHDAGGREADHRDGAGREPGVDQADRHQWRRLLQRELGASVRESDADGRTSFRCWRSS